MAAKIYIIKPIRQNGAVIARAAYRVAPRMAAYLYAREDFIAWRASKDHKI